MENISGYARAFARTRIKEQTSKPFLGKPYFKYGQCYMLWSYLVQLGGILGAKHSANLDAFIYVFVGARGPSGAAYKVCSEIAKKVPAGILNNPITFSDYVGAEFISRGGHSGDPSKYHIEHMMIKIPPEIANEQALEFSMAGVALGVIYPHKIRSMFDLTHKELPKENWARMYAAGLNISPTKDLMSYEEAEEIENKAFMDYCREFCPELYNILSK
jgi:hypothetical protein